MKVLVVICHYFKAESDPKHSSVDNAAADARRQNIENVISAWRSHFGQAAMLQYDRGVFEITQSQITGLDLAVVTTGDAHLLDKPLLDRWNVQQIDIKVDNPRMLPFSAHKIFAENRAKYDWFIYTEDDLLLRDSSFFTKQMAFQNQFGSSRVLQPNRFEFFISRNPAKTFIDGDLPKNMVDPFVSNKAEELFLHQNFGGTTVAHRRAANPHSGFFALTREQLNTWINQPHFLDLDCRFISSLESAATLGILKTFSIYKPFSAHAGFLEIEHLDDRFSRYQWPNY